MRVLATLIERFFTSLSKVIEELVWFWFYYALWLASVFTLVLVLRQSSENRSSSIDFVLTCLVTRPLLANSACAVNLLEESGTLVSHPDSPTWRRLTLTLQ